MVDGGEEVGLADRHAQHRHLQAREPDAHRGRNALFGQDALEQQRDDLDRRALDRRGRGLLQRLLALVQLLEQRRRADRGAAPCGARRAGGRRRCDALLRLVDRRASGRGDGGCRRDRVRDGELRQLAADQPVEAAEHRFGVVAARAPAAPRASSSASRRRPRRRAGARRRSWTRSCRWHAPVGAPKPPPPVAGRASSRVAWSRAPDQRAQVDLGQHVVLDQPAVGLVVRLFDELRELLVQHRLQQRASRRASARRARQASSTMRASTCGAQHVVRRRVRRGVSSMRHARAQVGELPRRAVHHRQRQPRAEDLALDRVVVDQRQLRRARTAGGGRSPGRDADSAARQRACAAPSTMPCCQTGAPLLQRRHQVARA